MARLKVFFQLGVLSALLTISPLPVVADDVTVIVSPDNTQALGNTDIARIYLGKSKRFPNGQPAVPLDLQPGDPRYVEFARRVLKKSTSQLNAYWAKRIFTGKGTPPRRVGGAKEMLKRVASNAEHIGYVGSDDVDDTVRPMAAESAE